MKALSLGVALFVAVAVGCTSDSTSGPASASEFVGDWLASSYVVTSIANTSLSEDLVVGQGMTLSLTFTETTYSGTAASPGEPTETFSGTYTISGNQMTLIETGQGTPELMTYTLSGNAMTLAGSDEEYDFDNDGVHDPATFTMVLAKQ